MMKLLTHLLPWLAVAALGGCAAVVGDVRPFADVAPSPYAPSPSRGTQGVPDASNAAPGARPVSQTVAYADGGGSIYAGGSGLKLFQDAKARDVGDLLTVVLVESTASKSSASTAVKKATAVDLAAPTVAGMPITYNGNPILQAGIDGSRDFSGTGNTAQSNQLNGNITVTVVQNLGNGQLLVSGEKRMRLNQGDELVQVQGIVRVADIGPDNRIRSDRVGDARIVYGGRGTIARSNAMGWLGRFFNSAAFPY